MSFKLEEYLPHRAPMILLSEILSVDETGATCAVTITEHSMFYDSGQVPGWVGIEYMAQTIAVYAGNLGRNKGEAPAIGFLLGARKYSSRQASFKLGQVLTVRAEPVLIDGDMGCFKATIRIADREVADATIMTYKASEEILKKMVSQL